MKKQIHVSCTSAYTYPERPRYLLVHGKKYDVIEIVESAKIQTAEPPFYTIHYFVVKIESNDLIEIEYHEQSNEWFVLHFNLFPLR